VGRIRYLGVLLYDADRIRDTAGVPNEKLVDAQRSILMDPFDPQVAEAAKKNGIPDDMIDAARNSPAFKFVKRWKLALPLHPEFRTLPMLYYVPPMLPVLAGSKNGTYDVADANTHHYRAKD